MHDTNDASDGRERLPRHTTPTWEMELLLSGATVFGLLQLPAVLDTGLHALLPRFDRETGALILLPFVYVKSAVHVLIVTFLLHLTLRGYWTALVGLRSVHPEGVDWNGMRWGPFYAALMKRRLASFDALVERADNRASQVFGYGIGFALALLAPLVVVGFTSLAAYALHLALGGTPGWRVLWYGLIGALLAPYLLASATDRWLGHRLTPDSTPARMLSALLAFYARIGFSTLANFPVVLFMSRYGRRRGGLLLMLAFSLVIGASLVGQLWNRPGRTVGQYGALAVGDVGSARTVLSEHYADRRPRHGTIAPLPYIDSAVVRGNYLRVFIPFRPTRDLPALRAHCPQVLATELGASMQQDSQAIGATLDCLARLYPITLDGAAVEDPRFDLAEDPLTGLRGMQAMLRVAEFSPGRHELQIGRPPDPARPAGDPAQAPFRIPFWR